jgi:transcription initiation factor IIF auxiliary subunit
VKNNLLFPVQIIVTSELDPKLHSSLRILTDHAEIEDVRQFLKEARTRNTPGERNNIDALLQASVAANFEVYEEIRRNSVMCEALRTLMKDEIELERQAAQKEGRKEGREYALYDLVQDGICPIEVAAQKLGCSESEVERRMAEAGYKIPEMV